MKCSLYQLLILLSLYNAAYALPYDSTTQKALNEIVSREEFQPRRETPGLLDHYRRELAAYFGHLLDQLGRWLDELSGTDLGNSMIYDWVVTLLVTLKYLFYGVVALLLLGPLGYLFYKHLRPLLLQKPNILSATSASGLTQDTQPSLEALFGEHRYFELLLSLHARIRHHLHHRFLIPVSTTDREAKRALTDNDPLSKLFIDLTPIFERAVFARMSLSESDVLSLYHRYHQIQSLR